MTPPMTKKRDLAELAIALFFLCLAGVLFYEVMQLPTTSGYSGVGPRMVPGAVGSGLLVVGVFLLYQAMTGGFRNIEHEGDGVKPNVAAVLWVVSGLVVFMLTAKPVGFVFAATALFVATSRGFGSQRWRFDLLCGVSIAIATFVFFNRILGVDLPYGVLKLFF